MRTFFQNGLLACLLAFAGATAVGAQSAAPVFQDITEMPAGLPGERARALLGAINAGTPDSIAAFFNRHVAAPFRDMFPMSEHEHMFRGMNRMTGGLDFYSIRSYTPARPHTVLIARDRLFGGWFGISYRLEGPDQRITEINFNPARPPAAAQAVEAPLAEADFIRTVQEKLDELCRKDAFSGVIRIAKGDQVLFEQACGEASKSWHVPNNTGTKFNLGSMNKMFTATAILQLVEKGKLRLDDPIGKYVDESWLPAQITGRVTIRHLLTHTSGLGSYFNETYQNSSRDLFRQVDDYKRLVQSDTLAFEPGSRFQYSNTGMLLLGVVIEKASGENYFDYIRQHIYIPAGMTGSDCYELDRPQENLAEGYLQAPDGGWKNNLFLHVLKGGPAGGGYATAGDLHRFARALHHVIKHVHKIIGFAGGPLGGFGHGAGHRQDRALDRLKHTLVGGFAGGAHDDRQIGGAERFFAAEAAGEAAPQLREDDA